MTPARGIALSLLLVVAPVLAGGPGNGNGGGKPGGKPGGGNPGGGNPGGGGPGGGSSLRLEIQPAVWNTNWALAGGTVSALLRGGGIDDVDPNSITLVGSDDSAGAITPQRVQTSGPQVRAFFLQRDAIALLDTPERGEEHELTLSVTVDGEAQELTATIRVVGPPPGDGDDDDDDDDDDSPELTLSVNPKRWNTNFARSMGQVSLVLRGDRSDLATIALASVRLAGTDTSKEAISPVRIQRVGNHIRAFFPKAAAYALLETPRPGEDHELELSFGIDGEAHRETVTIRVVGPGGN
jgi:hypothetical protein